MGRRGRAIATGAVIVAVVLFVGRWSAVVVTDYWWGDQIAPAAAAFLLQLHLLRLSLDALAVTVSAAWFIGNLFVVYRAVSVVQIPRYIANLEIREALTPRMLITVAIVTGAILGLVIGYGASDWWPAIAVAWHGAAYGVTEPLLNQDLGLYAAQLPLWRILHGYTLLLAILGVLFVVVLYLVVGSVRWLKGRPAISDHARRHIGLLLVAVALCLVWGYLLEPYELVGGIKRLEDAGAWGARVFGAQLLAGVGLGAAVASAIWAWRPRHTLLVSVWAILVATSLGVHLVAPSVSRTGEAVAPDATLRHFEAIAFGLSGLDTLSVSGTAAPPLEQPPIAVWDTRSIALLAQGPDSAELVSVSPATMAVGGARRPVWLMVRAMPTGATLVSAIGADRATANGSAMSYRLDDTVAFPSLTAMLELPPGALHPLSRFYRVDSLQQGFPVDSWFRRVMLAWGLQVGSVLRGLPSNATITWNLAPGARLRRLAPFAEWDTPVPRVVDGELVWIATGYVQSETFPLVSEQSWRGSDVRILSAGFLGTVHSRTGETHVYHRQSSDPLSAAWVGLAPGVVEPASDIPGPVRRVAPYPLELFPVQARVLEQPWWGFGRLVQSRNTFAPEVEASITWPRAGAEPALAAVYAKPGTRVVSALLEALPYGPDMLRVVRLDSTAGATVPQTLEARWQRFPLYEQVRDSVVAEGDEFATGPVRYGLVPGGLLATQSYFGRRTPRGRPQLAWTAVGYRLRLGAGRNPDEAWTNLLGESAPTPPGLGPVSRFEEARRWMVRADSALRAGRWTDFGSAFESLRRVFELERDSLP